MRHIKALIVYVTVVTLVACSTKPTGLVLTPQEVTNNGYYVYLLPEEFLAQQSWSQTILMYSLDLQCYFSDGAYNPVRIVYSGNDPQWPIEIRISPHDAVWGTRTDTKSVKLVADWIPTQQGEYYLPKDGGIVLKIKDKQNMDVIITSALDLKEVVKIVSKLKYSGPDQTAIGNPWQNKCKTK